MAKREVQILEGSVFKNLLLFTLPIALTGILQLFYNAADIIVVGRFAGSNSLAAVGATSSLTNLLVNLFIGLSVGTNVCVAQFIGMGGDHARKMVQRAVHTSVLLAFLGGLLLSVIGLIFSEPLLKMMDTPQDIIKEATLYMRIIFCGMPAMLVYNFSAAILRATGDSKTPLMFLSISGIVNVVLNLMFVILFHMGAAGVGMATICSQFLSAFLVLHFLTKQDTICKFSFRQLKMDPKMLKRIIRIGVPAGLQGIVFSFSNVQIQSSVNSFGAATVAGNAAAQNIEGFAYTAMNATHHGMMTFVGQNLGAGNKHRLKKILGTGCLQVTLIGIGISSLLLLFAQPLLNLYVPGEEVVIGYGIKRMTYMLNTYFLCGLMETIVGVTRGLGSSFIPMCVSIAGVCGIRLFWIFFVFQAFRTLECLYLSYPISWIVTAAVQLVFCLLLLKKKMKENIMIS